MARKYQHTQELLPKIKEMLEGGMTQREVAERLGVTGERAIHHLLTRERKRSYMAYRSSVVGNPQRPWQSTNTKTSA